MNETLNIQNGVSPITIDTKVTEGSTRPVMGGGIYEALTAIAEPFVVTCTPTAPDLTAGTMDKTVGEIYAAWQKGKRIAFEVVIPGIGGHRVFMNDTGVADGYEYPSFNCVLISLLGAGYKLATIYTGVTNNPDANSWLAIFFDLTPAT